MISLKSTGLFIALATLLISVAPGLAVTVNSTADPGDGVCDATECTLREAIAAAVSEETIDFSVTGTITLNPTAGQLTIDKRITVAGPGTANLTVQRDPAAAPFRIFYVTGGQLVTISDLTIANGNVADLTTFPANAGGAVFNDGNNLRLTRLVLTGNKAEKGGAVYASGARDESESDVTITDCTVSMNSADSTGGAIFNDTAGGEARVEIIRSTFTGNSAPAGGGAIYNFGRDPGDFGALLGISQSTFTGNTSNYGSVIYNDGERIASGAAGGRATCNVIASTLSGNTAAFDGTIYNHGEYGTANLKLENTKVSGNTANEGGAVFNDGFSSYQVAATGGATCDITDGSILTDNTTTRAGGAIYNLGYRGVARVNISDSSVTRNTADTGGAIANVGGGGPGRGQAASVSGIVITRSEISNNSTYRNANTASVGGAIYNYVDEGSTPITIESSTVGGNTALDEGGAIFSESMDSDAGNVEITITDSMVSGNSSAAGGAIYAKALNGITQVQIFRSTFAGNDGTGRGGAIAAYAAPGAANIQAGGVNVYLENATISGNTTDGSGGGIYGRAVVGGDTTGSGTVSVLSVASTFTFNAAQSGSAVFTEVTDGSIPSLTTLVLSHTILDSIPGEGGNVVMAGSDNIVSEGFNISSDATGANNGTTDLLNTNPLLGTLRDNGGPTWTHALLAGSPAIDTGDPAYDTTSVRTNNIDVDQRGFARIRGPRADRGAYEAAPAPVITAPANGARFKTAPAITGTAEPGATVQLTFIAGTQSVTQTVTADSNGNFSATPVLPDGSYSVTAAARIGNEAFSNPSNTRTFVLDTTPPVVSGVPADIVTEATGPNGATVSYSQPTANDAFDGAVPVTCAPTSGSTFPLGVTTVSCSASDQAGNTTNVSFKVTVRDTTPPTIRNVPQNITTTATGPNGAVVNYESPAADDTVSGQVPVTCNPPSGSTFPIGTTTVTCTATDAASNTAQATFTVTVQAASPTPTPSPTASPTPSPTASPSPSASPSATPAQPINISTRVNVGTGDNVMIGGFIITGSEPKRVIVRGIGPSTGIEGALANPVLELNGPAPFSTLTNDNWEQTQKDEIEQSQLAPEDPRESAIIVTLQPGAYTAVVRGQGNTTGIGLVEVYDLSLGAPSQLANISTRGVVETDDNVIIGGFILGGNAGDQVDVIVRAIGPSLANRGVSNALNNPAVDIRDKNGNPVAENDNWRDDSRAEDVARAQVAPESELESALYLSLPPGEYTAIVSGNGGATGVGLVEIYHIE